MKVVSNSFLAVVMSLFMFACTAGGNQQKDSCEPRCAWCIPEGGEWIVMFDGNTFDGWRGYNRKDIPSGWAVQNGEMIFDYANIDAFGGNDLIYDRKFQNFIFEIEWKLAKGGNGGVFYTVQEIEGTPIYFSSPEYQLLDNENMSNAWEGIGGNRQAGSVYDMIPPVPQPCNPYDTWNKTRIVVYNKRVIHYLNDVQVLEYQLGSPVWKALVERSKFSIYSTDDERIPEAYEFMLHAGSEPGYIGMQGHRLGPLAFRNIRIKEL
jgi:hypothetical protein